MKKIITSLMVFIILLSGCDSKEEAQPTPIAKQGETMTQQIEVPEGQEAIVTIKIEKFGEMTFKLFSDVPETTHNFIELVNSGFYDGLTSHRLIKDFMVQMGDPSGNGTGGPGYSIKGEFSNNGFANTHKHNVGSLAMARSGEPNSAGSQFYIVTGEEIGLDGDYAVFGEMITGQDVLEKLNNVKTQGQDVPVEPIVIESIKVDTKGIVYPAPNKLK